jgi:hypothetical protein
MMSPQPTKTDIIQKQKDLIKQLSNENQSYFDEIEGLKRQVSRGEIFRLREKIRLIEQDNKSYVLKLRKENEELKLYKDLKIKNWLNSAATVELKKDLEIRTKSRDKWKAVAMEEGDEIDVLLKENDKLKLALRS